MKKLLLLIVCTILFSNLYSQDDHQAIPASRTNSNAGITAADWQSDLRFLQQTVHKDYPFLFKKVTAIEFDKKVDELYKAMPAMQDHERMGGLARIIALFQYGHTRMGWEQSPYKYHVAPLNFYWFSDGLYVEGAQKEYATIVGAKLLKIEGKPVLDVLKKVKPLFPVENDQFYKAYGLSLIAIPEALHSQGITKELKKAITYTFEKNGKTFNQTVNARDLFRMPRNYGFVTPGPDWISVRDQNATPNYLRNLDKNYYYEYLPASKTVYVRQSQVLDDPEESIDAFYKKVFEFVDKNDVEKFVLDVRLNGGGNNYRNKPIVTGIIENEKINKPGKLFVIIGRRTFSACQNLVNELHNYTNAIFVGEPTAENINFYGDNRRVELPKTGVPVFLSFAWWQDKPQWENDDWLAPQMAVDLSFDEYRTNKDPILDACLNFSDKDPIIDPFGYLQDLFMQGKMDEVEKNAFKMIADPKYRYINFETKINEAGYKMLNDNQIEGALYAFQLNTKLYPKSANAYDSFAEANWKAKKTDKAIECYNKAIELDPNGVTGDNAREMLRRIQAEK